ncbi:MAG: thiol protease/hemagglutinin PrtT [Muribaculaceae bacterium]|nr:thiol protease/hemagglutinin PrtT [Muribaculaceae bacterium]
MAILNLVRLNRSIILSQKSGTRFLSLILISAAATTATARQLSPQEALDRTDHLTRSNNISLSFTYHSNQNKDINTIYIFNTNPGFLMVAADDVATPLLGYSEESDFQPDNIAPGMTYWLEYLSAQIEDSLEGYSNSQSTRSNEREKIPPLLTTTWNQDSPYNQFCPKFGQGRSMTGCIATAMAQVMNYHQWPAKCQGGTVSYTSQYYSYTQDLSMNFNEVSFDWGNMLDSYSSSSPDVNKDAVALLMQACGYSVEMNYSPIESFSYAFFIGESLNQYFNYSDKMQTPERKYYSDEEWESMVYNQLAQGLPVLYGGTSKSGGGHQFICDGYDGNGYYHFNWGWGGLSDGYFLLDALDPSSIGIGGGESGYNYMQEIVINVAKPEMEIAGATDYLVYCQDNFTTKNLGSNPASDAKESVVLGNSVVFFPEIYKGVVNNGCKQIQGYFGILLENENGETTDLYYNGLLSIGSFYSFYNFSITLPSNLAEGNYKISPIFKVKSEDYYFPLKCPVGCIQTLNMTVTGKRATITPGTVANGEAGIKEIKTEAISQIKIFKSGNGKLTITSSLPIKNVSVYSIGGEMTLSQNAIGLTEINLDIDSLKSGVNIVRVRLADGQVMTRKIIL